MAVAMQCDLCDVLEPGAPSQKVTVHPSLGHPEPLELCSECLMSFNDWRISRAPEQDRPA